MQSEIVIIRPKSKNLVYMLHGLKIMVAPLQGFTEAPFRHFHAEIYGKSLGDELEYYSPFIRLDRGEVRLRDLRDITSTLNQNIHLIPQIIFRDANEFIRLIKVLRDAGYNECDLNLGCPFIPQVRKGRGAGLILRSDILNEIASIMKHISNMQFSLKMRLGVNAPDEWIGIANIINTMPLSHVTIHPRTAAQQYSGNLQIDEIPNLINRIVHPIIFNGDIRQPKDIDNIRSKCPSLAGVMIGRGLLMRPSIINEWNEDCLWDRSERIAKLLLLHSKIYDYYATTLEGGDTQVLSKVKPLWEYFGADFDRKSIKRIIKAGSVSNYLAAINNLS